MVLSKRAKIKWLRRFKSKLKCEVCDEDHVACLDFHHLNPNSKSFAISDGVYNGYSVEEILIEISKCQVLCANCHRKSHYSHIKKKPAS